MLLPVSLCVVSPFSARSGGWARARGGGPGHAGRVVRANGVLVLHGLRDLLQLNGCIILGSSNLPWKERKELENRRVVSLGGKPPKKQRLPLSIARVTMKKQRERELEIQKENLILNRFERKPLGKSSTLTMKRRTEDKILKSSEGHFSRGVLNVKHLLQLEREKNQNTQFTSNGKKKKGGKRKGGGKKKGSKRR
ncbi:hypothetical protein Syun_021385 [Stephania yunnanensis]|uniref:Uncharacterized protein n=1 Tax=Stephania yunnanensis TaxID=152371 RepID=A0AAP0IGH9_9MAGN